MAYTDSKGQVSLFFRIVDCCKLELVNPRFSLLQSEKYMPRTVIKILLGEARVLGVGAKNLSRLNESCRAIWSS